MKTVIGIIIMMLLILTGCATRVSKEELSRYFPRSYMGTQNGYHHFMGQEFETVFYKHLKVSANEYHLDDTMPFTRDKTEWEPIEDFYFLFEMEPSLSTQTNADGTITVFDK
jgi:hypothetical protein